jgi:hypothetical protein
MYVGSVCKLTLPRFGLHCSMICEHSIIRFRGLLQSRIVVITSRQHHIDVIILLI